MLHYEELIAQGKRVGFTHVAPLKTSTMQLRPEVRQMCESNTCGKYGANWSCPPGCGSLEECQRRIDSYTEGILVQTVGQLEDEMDGEGMIETEKRHKEGFLRFFEELRQQYDEVLAIGAGCCTQCAQCTYPNMPCRFPERRVSSMEAYGMLVLQVCKDNGLPYYYGPCTIAYTSCFLLK